MLSKWRQSALYKSLCRPLIWAPIKLVRTYQSLQHEQMYRRYESIEIPSLIHARQEYENSYSHQANPLVTVTIPTYNRAKIVAERNIPSVLAQTYKNFEIVVVGDHCTDNTGELIAKINDPRIRFHNLPIRPQYPTHKVARWRTAGTFAMNAAIAMAQGQWLTHLDDDDIYMSDHIEILLAHAQAGNYEFLFAKSRLEIRTGEWLERGGPNNKGVSPGNLIKDSFISHSTIFYRTYLRLIAYDPYCWKWQLGGDVQRWNRMSRAGVCAGFLDKVVVDLPLHPGETERTISQPAG